MKKKVAIWLTVIMVLLGLGAWLSNRQKSEQIYKFSNEGRQWTKTDKDTLSSYLVYKISLIKQLTGVEIETREISWVLSKDINRDCGNAPACYDESNKKIYLSGFVGDSSNLVIHELIHNLWGKYKLMGLFNEGLTQSLTGLVNNGRNMSDDDYAVMKTNKPIYVGFIWSDTKDAYYSAAAYEMRKIYDSNPDFYKSLLTNLAADNNRTDFTSSTTIKKLIEESINGQVEGMDKTAWLGNSFLFKCIDYEAIAGTQILTAIPFFGGRKVIISPDLVNNGKNYFVEVNMIRKQVAIDSYSKYGVAVYEKSELPTGMKSYVLLDENYNTIISIEGV